MKKNSLIIALLACTMLLFSLDSNAGNKGNKNNGSKKEGKRVPIDGGISLLLVAGTAFGVKKVVEKNRKKELPSQ